MSRLLPLGDTDFWWLRYFCGIFLPLVFAAYGIYSMISLHSYTFWTTRNYIRFVPVRLVPVHGEQALLMGFAYVGIALMLFAHCYAQYHEKMGFYYQWIFALGILLAGGGTLWCSWIFLVR